MIINFKTGMCLGFLVMMLIACQSSTTSELSSLNLTEYGLPISVKAPADAEIKTREYGYIKDISVKDDDAFYLQIFSHDLRTNDLKRIIDDLRKDVQSEAHFSKIIQEFDNGFIYENVVDSTLINYGFRAIRLQGDYEIQFQQGLLGTFDLQEVERMYDAVN